MKVIKFEGGERQKHCWQAIRKNVNAYFKEKGISPKGNAEMKIKSAVMIALYLVPLAAIFSFQESMWLLIPAALLAGVGKAGIGMAVMHDGLHGSYSAKKRVNNLMGGCMYLIGSNVFNWKIQHNIHHHAYTNIEGLDEDIQSRWIMRFSEHTPLRNIHKLQHIYAFFLYPLMTFSMLFGDYTQLIGYHRSGILKKHQARLSDELIKMSIAKTIYLFVMIVLPLMITAYSWWQVLLYFALMHFVAGFIMTVVFQMAHIVEGVEQPLTNETGLTENEWAIHQLLTTANFARNNKVLSWYAGGLNFQVEHHLFPNICHVHYRHISPIVERTAKEFGISYHTKPTLWAALLSHSRRLKELGAEDVPDNLLAAEPLLMPVPANICEDFTSMQTG